MGRVDRYTEEDIDSVRVERQGVVEWFITARSTRHGVPVAVLLDRWLCAHPAVAAVWQFSVGYFAGIGVTGGVKWPNVCIGSAGAEGVSSAFLHGVEGAEPERLLLNGRVVGSGFRDYAARYVWLGPFESKGRSVHGNKTSGSVFGQIGDCLSSAGTGFRNLVRTWFFLRDIGSSYDTFNAERLASYDAVGIAHGVLPSSTGVGSCDPRSADIVAACMAVIPSAQGVTVRAITSPAQCPPASYGSHFSRALEVRTPDHRRLMVSGTASIGTDGKTLDASDPRKQISNTLDAVDAILRAGGVKWGEITSAVAYLRDNDLLDQVCGRCTERGLDPRSLLAARAAICRP